MERETNIYLKLLRGILAVYIILCIIIAGLNYGYAGNAPKNIARMIEWIWLIYENVIKTAFILIGSFLVLKLSNPKKRGGMKRVSLIGFMMSALAVHIVLPLLTFNFELYFYAMPLPWTTTPLQLLDPGSSLYQGTVNAWGVHGVAVAWIFFICITIIVIVGTLLFGRRFQCSGICLFNGFASEVFGPAMPLVGKRKKVTKKTLRVMFILRWLFLCIALFFVAYWFFYLLGVSLPGDIAVVAKIESYKYLAGELLMMMFFWVAFVPRGYCFYCPLGTVLSLLSKIAGQRITSGNTECIHCGKCSQACPMSIDIASKAVLGEDISDIRCVGCGHCVDGCPTENLAYRTVFLNRISEFRQKGKKG